MLSRRYRGDAYVEANNIQPKRINVVLSRVGLSISAQASHRTVRDSLPSHGSSYSVCIDFLLLAVGVTPHIQW